MTKKIYDIAIIGAGSAGVMAALRGVLNNDRVILFPGNIRNKRRSRAKWVKKVENIPGFLDFNKGIEDPNKQAINFITQSEYAENFTLLENTGIQSLEKQDDLFLLKDSEEKNHYARHIVLATGVMDVQPHINGSIKPIFKFANKQQVDYCLRCDGHHIKGKETTVIGHTDSAAWVAIMLYERYSPPTMTILTNGQESKFSDETKKLIDLYKIDVIEDEIIDLRGEVETGLEGYILDSGHYVHSDFTFISLGMIVYNELALQLGAKVDQRGFIITNDKGESSIENLYIAGDLRAGIKKQIYSAWDSAVDSLDDINRKIRLKKREDALKKSAHMNYL